MACKWGTIEIVVKPRVTIAIAVCALLAIPPAARGKVPSAVRKKLREYKTRYYTIYTDLDRDAVREAAARLTSMAREYQHRTRGFARKLSRRMPVYLFSRREDYYAAGAKQGSSGMYTGDELMAVASGGSSGRLWHIVQHEGYHQYSGKVIRARVPVWVEEGMAEYFAEGLWTGDGLVTGVVSAWRLFVLKGMIHTRQITPFEKMMTMTYSQWSSQIKMSNYTQAWSMVHFLVHGEGGKYRDKFAGFINDTAKGYAWQRAFTRRFGDNKESFQRRHAAWWSQLSPAATADRHTVATVETLTSFLARAHLAGQQFASADAFLRAARGRSLRMRDQHWLPASLLAGATAKAAKLKGWSLEVVRKRPQLVLPRAEGGRFVCTFTVDSDGGIRTTTTIHLPASK